MFVLTTLVYPVVLALLCLGGALLVDRASGGLLPATLFPVVGAAVLIVLSQLSTYIAPLAPATPYLLVALALAGLLLGRQRLRTLAGAWRSSIWQLLVCPLAYVLAFAPVLLAGRPTFSSYMALADSAVHMLGADYPDSPRAGLLAPGPTQLLRAIRSQLLRIELSLRRRHSVRRQLVPARPAADLDVPAVRRVHARDRRGPSLALGPACGLARRLGGARDAHGHAAGARVCV